MQGMSVPITRLVTAWQLVVKRAIAHWRLLSTVIIGVLMASAILAGTVIYFDALRELALKAALNKITTNETNILLRAERGPTSAAEYERVSRLVDREVGAWVPWLLRGRERAGKSATFFLTTPDKLNDIEHAGETDQRSYFAFLPGFEDRISLLPGGQMPQERPLNDPGQPLIIEAIIPLDAAKRFDLGVGDTLIAVPFWEARIPYATVIISGLFERTDPGDEFWHMDDTVLRPATESSLRTVQFHLSEKAFMEVLGNAFPDLDSTYAWLLEVDEGKINAHNARDAFFGMRFMDERLREKLFSFQQLSSLDEVIKEHERRLFFTKLPMFVVLILIAIVILYYVVTLSSMLVEQQREEISLLRGRGATSSQILTVFVLEGATISVMAALVAPVIAAAVISILGFTPAFSDLSGTERLSVSITRGAYMMSALGGVLSFVALMVPAVQASRIGVARHRQEGARPTGLPAFQRYYLDVALLIVVILLFHQLTEQGSVVGTKLFGDVVVNQLLLAVPAVILVASAMVLLRLFPVAMNLGSHLLSNWLPVGLVLGLWQMARNPTHYARLSLLLILTAGLGIFAASFGGTLNRSFEERVLYATGSEIRAEGILLDRRGTTTPIAPSYKELPGIVQVASAFRGGGLDLSTFFGSSYVMFAMDQDQFEDVAWFRDDFSKKPMDELLASLKGTTLPQGILLPADSESIGVVVKSNRVQPTVQVIARLRDANGRHFSYALGTLTSSQWLVLESSVSRGGMGARRMRPVPPLTLISIIVSQGDLNEDLQSGSLLIDRVHVTTTDGTRKIIDSFEDESKWSVLRASRGSRGDELHRSTASYDGDSRSLIFIWTDGSSLTSRGIFHGPPLAPLPVLASQSFLKETGHSIGGEFEVSVNGRRVMVQPVGTIDYFPTMDTINEAWLISDLSSLIRYANLEATFGDLYPNEMWLSTQTDGLARAQLVEQLAEHPFTASKIYDRQQELADSQLDPLVEAGWRALLFIAFGTVLILSCMGFLVHAYVSFRSREGQFALLRTVGLSTKQLVTLVWLEQALVIAAGMALGTWMGGRLGETIMPYIGHDDRGGQVLPPFDLDVSWGILIAVYAAMALVFGVIIMGVIFFIQRISLQRVLRLGEL